MAYAKISDLTAATSVAATDLLEISQDAGGGTFTSKKVTGANALGVYALLSGTNQPFTGNLNVSVAATPEIRLTDTASDYSRYVRLTTSNAGILYNRVLPVAGTPAKDTYGYTGSTVNWTVPAGVSSITVKLWGGGGGSGGTYGSPNGGEGGFTQATYVVTPGQTITFAVAGGGTGNTSDVGGGYNGGGDAGLNGGTANLKVGAGGGLSSVMIGATTVAIAGGGGGAGYRAGVNGGMGGGTTGVSGDWISSSGTEGTGGSQVAGGIGQGTYPGQNGSSLQGGHGYDDASVNGRQSGGGGGGYYGGGGGGSAPPKYGGGGGGSSYVNPSCTGTSLIQGKNGSDADWSVGIAVGGTAQGNGGNGKIVVSYAVAAIGEFKVLSSQDGSATVNSNVLVQLGSYSTTVGSDNILEGIQQRFNILGATKGTLTGAGMAWTLPNTITGSSDAIQLKVIANATQTNDVFRVLASDGTTVRLSQDNKGYLEIGNSTGANNVMILGVTNGAPASQTGNFNTACGDKAFKGATSGASNAVFGYNAGALLSSGSGDVFLGANAGNRQTTAGNILLIDNQDRTTAALELTNALVYGVFNATPASQTLTVNAGTFTVAYGSAQSTIARGLVVNAGLVSGATGVFNVKGSGDQNLIVSDTVNDRIGIGVASPTDKLSVYGSVAITGLAGQSNLSKGLILNSLSGNTATDAFQVNDASGTFILTDPTSARMLLSKMVYGSMSGKEVSISVSTALTTTYYAVGTGLSTGTLNGFTFANSALTALVAGKYLVNWSISMTGGSNRDHLEGAVLTNATASLTAVIASAGHIANNTDEVVVGATGVLTLAANDVVRLAVQDETTGSSTLTVTHATMTLLRIDS